MKRKNVMQFLSGLMIAAMVATSAVVIPENVEAATTATVTTQAQLDKALKSNVKKTVVIKTTKKQTLSVKAGTYSKITLKVDAPKVTLTNKGKFAKIQVVDAETVTDKKSGNSYSISDKKLTLSVAKGVKASAVTYSGVNGTLTIKGEGAVKAFKISKAYGSVIKNSTKKKLVVTHGSKKVTVKAGSKKTIEDTTKVNDLSYAEYSLKWQDDFKGTKLNRDDWNVELHDPGWVNAELQAYVDSDANIEVKDGMLYLNPIQTKNADGTYSYTSGRVNAPAAQNDKAEIRQLEPYCYGQFTEGKASPCFGRSHVHWLTGTASTVMVGCVEGIMGMRPDFYGLKIDPSIPSEWDGFEIEKDFRGKYLHIVVKNPGHAESGCKKMLVNGTEVEGNYIKEDMLAETNEIEYLMS